MNDRLVRGFNSIFIVLIPKKSYPLNLGDYRPISLLSGLYKLLSKVITKRIKQVIGNLIAGVQSGFINDRSILNGVLVANEKLDELKKKKKKGFMIKMDFKKAYDKLEWNFLFSIMKSMNFGSNMIRWIKECCSSASISVLVNGAQLKSSRWVVGFDKVI